MLTRRGWVCLYCSLATETLATKMKDLQSGQCIDISSMMKVDDKKLRE